MDQPDLRASELNELILALAKFAVQLDAFEARFKGRAPNPPRPASLEIGFATKIVSAMKSLSPSDQSNGQEGRKQKDRSRAIARYL
jgi:hypothetical protein